MFLELVGECQRNSKRERERKEQDEEERRNIEDKEKKKRTCLVEEKNFEAKRFQNECNKLKGEID